MGDRAAEVIGGRRYPRARRGVAGARAGSRLGVLLGAPFDMGVVGPGGWVILDQPELHLGPDPDIVVPDLAAWRRDRLPELPETLVVTLPPDWVGEVFSAEPEEVVRAAKLPVYAREGVPHVWLLEPTARRLEVLRLEGNGYCVVATWRGNAFARAEPFDAIDLPLASLWAS